jgi:phage tail sheath gpL-like
MNLTLLGMQLWNLFFNSNNGATIQNAPAKCPPDASITGLFSSMIASPGSPVNAVAATGTLTATGNPANNATVTIGGKVYTFKTALSEPAVENEVLIGETASASLDNLIAAITADESGEGTTFSTGTEEHPTVDAAAGAGDTVTLTAKTRGAAGNSIVTTETSSGLSFAHATLTGGVDGTVGFAGQRMYDTTYDYLCVATNTISGRNWTRKANGSAY